MAIEQRRREALQGHTPGPWTPNREDMHNPQRVNSEAGYEVATIYGSSKAQREANARLIAAAPEATAANCEALEFFVQRNLEAGDEEAQRVANILRAAIAKAKCSSSS